MNRVQKNYMASEAALKEIEAALAEKELKFLQSRGRKEAHVWAIEEEAIFDLLNVEFSATVKGMAAARTAARLALKDAENALIEYALSLAPAGIRETLRQGARDYLKIRKDLIDTAMRLDTSTVPA
jgi:hypothetical protein